MSYDILAGYAPEMNDHEKAWLDGHNIRRKAFHEQHGTEYRPLLWSPELARDASNWVDAILPTCKFIREPNLEQGENVSNKRYNSRSDDKEDPEVILYRWSDLVLEQDKDYPYNNRMTQVMWRSTRYIGCSNKFLQNDVDGSYCYVSICRYSRPGNCAVGTYDNWLIPTLEEYTTCGKACPEEGCY
ncbi:hypothetical protein ACHAXR_006700 [Thalassiosira sp. AJA248-18]